MEKERLEREKKQLQSQLQKAEFAAALARDKQKQEKASQFSKRVQEGKFMKQPKAVTLIPAKKKQKSLKTETIKSVDEEDEPDTIPEGFHLQEESPHCLNMQRSKDYQAYLRQVVIKFERLLKAGGKDMHEAYGQILKSFYWACRANKNNIIEDTDRDQVLQSIKNPSCKAWKMKLNGRKMVDPTSIIDEAPIGPQMASELVSMKLEEMFEMLEEEIARKTPEQVQHIAVKIPEVDDMLERAQQKVEAIKKAKEATSGVRPIDQVIFAQNCLTWNPEWAHSIEGRLTAYLASLVMRYMDEWMRKDSQMVMSARSLETIYHIASSLVGKLISGKHYIGGYELDKLRDKNEKEGVPLAQRTKHKLPAKPSMSTMIHD